MSFIDSTRQDRLGKAAVSSASHSSKSGGRGTRRFRLRLPTAKEWLLMAAGAGATLACVGIITLISHGRPAVPDKGQGITASWVPGTVRRWQGPIDDMAKKYNVDPNLIAIIMIMESGGYSKANSGEAEGLMQITPLTAKDIASKYLKQPVSRYNLWDPRTNIEFGTAYLAYLRDTFGSWQQGPSWNSAVELMAAGYNGGPGAAAKLDAGKGLNDPQTVIYSRDAFNMWRERQAGDSPTYDRWLDRGGSILVDAAKAEQH